MDPWDDELCDLVDVTRVKFMEAQGAQDRPPAIQYLSINFVTSGADNEGVLLSLTCKNLRKQEKRGCEKIKKITFKGYLAFQSDALEFSKCQMHGKNAKKDDGRKSRSQEAEFQERIRRG